MIRRPASSFAAAFWTSESCNKRTFRRRGSVADGFRSDTSRSISIATLLTRGLSSLITVKRPPMTLLLWYSPALMRGSRRAQRAAKRISSAMSVIAALTSDEARRPAAWAWACAAVEEEE